MMVIWKRAEVVDIVVEVLREPDVLLNDLCCLLNHVAVVLFVL
jgi:hypothetical protein